MISVPRKIPGTSYIKSGSIGIISGRNQETAVPCPYNIIFGRDTARPSPLYHSGATGIDIKTNPKHTAPLNLFLNILAQQTAGPKS